MKLFRSGFVDDTAGYVNQFLEDIPPSPEKMIRMLTHDSQGRQGEPLSYQSVCTIIGIISSHRRVDRIFKPHR
jgi:hypothetical protein